jgi:hypothetical protein
MSFGQCRSETVQLKDRILAKPTIQSKGRRILQESQQAKPEKNLMLQAAELSRWRTNSAELILILARGERLHHRAPQERLCALWLRPCLH